MLTSFLAVLLSLFGNAYSIGGGPILISQPDSGIGGGPILVSRPASGIGGGPILVARPQSGSGDPLN